MKKVIRLIAGVLALVMVLGALPALAAQGPDPIRAADAYLAQFTYEDGGRRYFESCGGWEFWQCVESVEVVIDVYERTGEEKYLTAARALFDGFIAGNKSGARKENWSGNDYNDDIMWGVIAAARLYLLTGNGYYLDVAKSNFDLCYARGWDESFLGGGMWWKTLDSMDPDSKNACIQGPAAIAACLLGDATGDRGYYDKAKAIIDWTIAHLYQSDGALWDSVYVGRDPNKWCSTYNQGTFIGACTMLAKHFDDVDYLSYAKKAAQRATKLNLNGEQNTGDLIGFKGILARWLGCYCRESGDDSFVGYMREWANTVWNNRNSSDLMWTRFNSKTPDDLKNQTISNVDAGSWGYWGCSAAVSWVVNTPGIADRADTVTERLEAEKGILTPGAESRNNDRASGGMLVGNLGDRDNDSVTFTLTCPDDTAATLRLYSATAMDREYGVSVNGGETRPVKVSSNGSWTEVSYTPAVLEITLKIGNNTIVVGGTGGPAPNLDCIEVEYLRPAPFANPFTDVFERDYFHTPVLWAAKKGITTGDGTADVFNPGGACTRAQVVTFLWRMAGKPESGGEVPFSDVSGNAYYREAVAWALDRGITTGTAQTTFSPDDTCTRAQVATFLWRMAGKPECGGENPFRDLAEGAYYVPAVLWAAEEGITTGDGEADVFNPEGECTRAQIVTFLYRYAVR